MFAAASWLNATRQPDRSHAKRAVTLADEATRASCINYPSQKYHSSQADEPFNAMQHQLPTTSACSAVIFRLEFDEFAQEDTGTAQDPRIMPLHPANIHFIPAPNARVNLALPKECSLSRLNGQCATVLSATHAKSSSGDVTVPLLPPLERSHAPYCHYPADPCEARR